MPLPERFRVRALYEDVARQHALLDQLLPRTLRETSSIAYILYRMLDTLEDGPFPPEAAVVRLQAAGEDLMIGIAASRRLVLETPGLEPSYRALFEHWDLIHDRYDRLPNYARVAIAETGKFMARGMARWRAMSDHAQEAARPDFIPDLPALDDYCHAVAGCVGELHTRLFQASASFRDDADPQLALVRGASLGNYLQLVNVIRDESEERAEHHRTFFPSSLLGLEPADRLAALIAHAQTNEAAIESYIATLKPGPVRAYVTTLFRVAQVHYAHYARHPEVLDRRTSPPASELWAVLPWRLRLGYISHKIGF